VSEPFHPEPRQEPGLVNRLSRPDHPSSLKQAAADLRASVATAGSVFPAAAKPFHRGSAAFLVAGQVSRDRGWASL
jgi:hypothetical protein